MANSTFSVRMDSDVKRQLDEFCAEVGMGTSTAINLFARTVVRNRRLPFEITSDVLTKDELVSRASDFESGKNIVTHDLIEV
ncbi:MAG: type II toxin-antitoxin system RelB/DinJ family antitoxin [Coriobacteriia bacterium]|nr:type II toxin-antitoxin system RelB/DinJ family antitoxin [Coriobacteriia bacterium]